MIPKDYITEWRQFAPWVTDAQVEQDLVISRTLLTIYSDKNLAEAFAFRGGTALYKLFFADKSARYSEDIDLVQVNAEAIGKNLDQLRAILDPWLGKPQRNNKEGTVNLIYRFASEDQPPRPLRLKVEINSREHYSAFGYRRQQFEMKSRWSSRQASILTYDLDELLGTKLRALYQRKKGRDLFDLWFGLESNKVDPDMVVKAFLFYTKKQGLTITRKEFLENLDLKSTLSDFKDDITPLLRPDQTYNWQVALNIIKERLVGKLD